MRRCSHVDITAPEAWRQCLTRPPMIDWMVEPDFAGTIGQTFPIRRRGGQTRWAAAVLTLSSSCWTTSGSPNSAATDRTKP